MVRFQPGQTVLIPCEIQPGAFPTERLVTVKTDQGEVSGFIRIDFLVSRSGPAAPTEGAAYVVGLVEAETPDQVTVKLPGSFFTTASGVTSVSSSWARQHITRAEELRA